jgi:PIN domain nuclease of toxin-antitoxin system
MHRPCSRCCFGEDGGDQVQERLASSQISAVNRSEVFAKLQKGGVPEEVITPSLAELNFDGRAFDQSQAARARLSTAQACKAVAVSTDRAWDKLEIDMAVDVLR